MHISRTWMTLVASVALTLALGGAALAHANYVSSVPAAGTTVAKAPAAVTITFSEELAVGSTALVFDSMGMRVSTGSAINPNDRTMLSVPLSAGLANGVYTVSWATIAADDNASKTGTFTFTVGTAPSNAVAKLPNTSTADTRSAIALGFLVIAAALALVSARNIRARAAHR